MPSADMPKPENIRRIATGPKSANRSIRKSRSIEYRSHPYPSSRDSSVRAVALIVAPSEPHRNRLVKRPAKGNSGGYGSRLTAGTTWWLDLRRRQLHGFAAATGAGLVRVVEDELRLHLVGLVIHLGAEQEQHGLGIDQDLDALVLDDLVGGANIVGIFDRIGLPGAAAVLDPDPQAHDLGIGAPGQFRNPLRRRFRQLHHLRTRPRLRLGGRYR